LTRASAELLNRASGRSTTNSPVAAANPGRAEITRINERRRATVSTIDGQATAVPPPDEEDESGVGATPPIDPPQASINRNWG
jgi:hypothetical protein